MELQVSSWEMPVAIKNLRTGNLKTAREARNAALFAHGMASIVGEKVLVSPGEDADADFFTCVGTGDSRKFTSIQLKELVPGHLNPSQTIADLMGAQRQRPPTDTILAVLINRRMRPAYAELASYRVPFSELWFYWAASEDQSQWQIYGDAQSQPRLYDFTYPAP